MGLRSKKLRLRLIEANIHERRLTHTVSHEDFFTENPNSTRDGGNWFFEIQINGAITTSLKSVVIHGRPMASPWGNATPCCPTGHRSQPKMAFSLLLRTACMIIVSRIF